MRKIYYVECDSDYGCYGYLEQDINELGYSGYYPNKTQAKKAMVELKNIALKQFAHSIKREKKNGNTMTIDVWEAVVCDNFNEEEDSIWEFERQLIEMRYLCGRY